MAKDIFFTADGPVSTNNGGLALSYGRTCRSIVGVFNCSNKVNFVTVRAAVKFTGDANKVAATIY